MFSEESERARVLFVCDANVCRSPFLAAMFEARWTDPARSVDVVSAGLVATDGQSPCPVAVARLGTMGIPLTNGHRSRRLTSAELSGTDLVLCATRAQRSAVIRLAPAVRSRTFALMEAAALAEVVGDHGNTREDGGNVTQLARRLDQSRGLVALSAESGQGRRRRDSTRNREDIPDAHSELGIHHADLFPLMEKGVLSLTGAG